MATRVLLGIYEVVTGGLQEVYWGAIGHLQGVSKGATAHDVKCWGIPKYPPGGGI